MARSLKKFASNEIVEFFNVKKLSNYNCQIVEFPIKLSSINDAPTLKGLLRLSVCIRRRSFSLLVKELHKWRDWMINDSN